MASTETHHPVGMSCTAQNSYQHIKPSYKEMLLSTTACNNRMGVNSFQLLHLLWKKTQPIDDEMSIQSDDTNPQSNQEPIHTSRIRVVIL
jgi:hypothetical protein